MSYFPLLIEYKDGSRVVVENPADIKSGVGFKVVQTNYGKKK